MRNLKEEWALWFEMLVRSLIEVLVVSLLMGSTHRDQCPSFRRERCLETFRFHPA